jgi:hypothetical protein
MPSDGLAGGGLCDMNKPSNLPVEGKAIRFAPSRNQEPATSLWKVWAEGNEVYALSRGIKTMKISVHESGQVHYRLRPKLKQDMAPLMQLGTGPWLHAFELRFLLSDGAFAPLGQREALKNRSGYLIPTPDGFVLYANLIIGCGGTPLDYSLPVEFTPAGQTLWRTRLRDGRTAVLVARLLPTDDQNREYIRYVREERKTAATFSTTPTRKYLELCDLHWSAEGGNVLLVVPTGEEAFRSEQDFVQADMLPLAPRHFRCRSFPCTVEVTAPNGLGVAVIELPEVNEEVELVKGTPKTVELGSVTMRIETNNLIARGRFIARPRIVTLSLTVGGASPHNWEYTIEARFDGSCLSAEINANSTSFQNRNLATPVHDLGSGEEIVVVIPTGGLKLSSTLDLPSASTELLGRFTLRDRL